MYPSHVVACRGIASCDSIRLVHGVVNGKRGSEGTKAEGAEMGISFINDPEHWRNRAEEARTLADQMNEEPSKQMMLRIAAEYDRLAERAELRAQGASPQRPKGSSPAG